MCSSDLVGFLKRNRRVFATGNGEKGVGYFLDKLKMKTSMSLWLDKAPGLMKGGSWSCHKCGRVPLLCKIATEICLFGGCPICFSPVKCPEIGRCCGVYP